VAIVILRGFFYFSPANIVAVLVHARGKVHDDDDDDSDLRKPQISKCNGRAS
jgi:hypothetical protein